MKSRRIDVRKNKDSDFWKHAEEASKIVARWPCWKKMEHCGECAWCLEADTRDANGLTKAATKIKIRKAEDKELLQHIKYLEEDLKDARKKAKGRGLI